jgi:hypothetical protein
MKRILMDFIRIRSTPKYLGNLKNFGRLLTPVNMVLREKAAHGHCTMGQVYILKHIVVENILFD